MEFISLQTLYFVIIMCGQLHAIDQSEPRCYSRFDYDEKLLLKLLKIEDEVGKFRQFIDAFKIKEDALEQQRQQEYELFMKAEQQRKQEQEQFMMAMNEIDTFLDTLYKNVNNSLKVLDTELSQFKQEVTPIAAPVGFTVKGPKDNVENYITFYTIVTDEGESYDQTSGKFTCSVPGVYYFSVHILKVRLGSTSNAQCYICMNGTLEVEAYSGPYAGSRAANKGHYGTSSSVYLRLNKGDVVGLCSCSSVSSMNGNTSFSGHLVSRV